MEMRKCVNGHYYDASINTACPYCKPGRNTGRPMPPDAGMSMSVDEDGDFRTLPRGYGAQSAANANMSVDDDDNRTIAVVQQNMGIDPVVGWLVCVNGKEKGRDYRIHSDNNFIGRSEKMDICVRGDETISREKHAVVSYDSSDRIYYFSPGEGRNIVRYNGKAIFQTVELNMYDRIVIGKTELVFMPLCGHDFDWSNEECRYLKRTGKSL